MKIMFVKNRNILDSAFFIRFLKMLADCGHEVVVVGSSRNKIGSGVGLDQRVRLINLCARHLSLGADLWCRIRDRTGFNFLDYRRMLLRERPDIVIACFPADLVNVMLFQPAIAPVVLMIHCYPPILFGGLRTGFALKRLSVRYCLRRVAAFQVLMPSFKELLRKGVFVVSGRSLSAQAVAIIANVVPKPLTEQLNDRAVEKRKVVYIARIEKEGKRQHLAIEAFAAVAMQHPEWSLELWGVAKHKKYNNMLAQQIRDYGLENRIRLMGHAADVSAVFHSADIQLFTSLHEGFGLGLAEGLAHGIPAVGFKETPAVNELITDGVNGFLAVNLADMAEKLRLLIGDRDLRHRMGVAAVESVAKYDAQRIAAEWNDFLLRTVERWNGGKR